MGTQVASIRYLLTLLNNCELISHVFCIGFGSWNDEAASNIQAQIFTHEKNFNEPDKSYEWKMHIAPEEDDYDRESTLDSGFEDYYTSL